jgi:hypothetical protein
MPVTDELGTQAVELLAARGRSMSPTQMGFGPGLNVENWLSLLSEEQPQLSEAYNRENAAMFARLRDAISELLLQAKTEALGRQAPAWLYDLVSVWHRRRAIVLTLNYDSLVEAAVSGHQLWDPAGSAARKTNRPAPWPPAAAQHWSASRRSNVQHVPTAQAPRIARLVGRP